MSKGKGVFKLAAVIGYSGSVLRLFAEAWESLRKEGYGIELRAVTPRSTIDWEEFISYAQGADALLFYGSSSFERIDELSKGKPDRIVVSFGEGGIEGNVHPSAALEAERYYKFGGIRNLKNLILFLGKLAGWDFQPAPPEPIPWQGIYHPQLGVFASREEYEKVYPLKARVGLLFYRSQWENGDTATVDLLVHKLEGEKIGVVPVFSYSMSDPRLGIPGNEEALKLLEGCDLILNLQSFTLLRGDLTPLEKLDVPILQGIKEYYKSEEEWRADPQGISPMSQVMSVAQPEISGTIEPILISAKVEVSEPRIKGNYALQMPIGDRADLIVRRIKGWLTLQRKPIPQRRITFVLHNAPCKSVEATVGRGYGLDTLESLVRVMRAMKEMGYRVEGIPESGEDLVRMILDRKAISEFRWTTTDEIVSKGGVLEHIDAQRYERWFDSLPKSAQKKVIESWGDPPGEAMVYEGKILVTGLNFGNVNVILQPKRGCAGAKCDGKVCKILHDPTLPPPHHWLATYMWIAQNSDLVVHVGTHGALEFLPGKGVGLAQEDFPEISISDKPHLYIYTISNPPEGIIAKRRSYATLIDHLIPTISPSGLYDDLEEIDGLLRQYEDARRTEDDARMKVLERQITDLALKANLIEGEEEFEEIREKLHSRLTLMRETMIPYGLHILGEPPQGDELVDMLVSILRFDGDVPSIRRGIIEVEGGNYDEVLQDPSSGKFLDEVTEKARKLMKLALERGTDGGIIEETLQVRNPGAIEVLRRTVEYGLEVARELEATRREISQLLRGMNGEYIEPGASGSLTRGRVEVLPTGRNFYGVDPWRVPTPAAIEVGQQLAEKLLHRYLHEEGEYPESVGMVLFSMDVFRADGEEVAQILHLLGVKPKWDKGGRARGIEIIPLQKLGRPRIDVTVRLSGIMRDTLPHIWEMIDEAVRAVSCLDEPPEMNYIRKHKLEAMERGLSEREATFRVFAAQPGSYGAGVNYAVEASAWENEEDLRDVYVDWGGYAYGKDVYGQPAHKSFAFNLSKVKVSFNKLESDEHDLLGCCCYFAYQGGMTAAVKSISGEDVKTYWGDTRDPDRIDVRDMKDEIERVVRTRLLNPKWLEGMRRHGYKGAGDISSRVVHLYGWDATAGVVEDWIYDEIQRRIVAGMKEWFMEHNPYALEEIARRLLEAHSRGMWNADEESLEELREIYMELEGILEDEERRGEFQGGDVRIFTKRDVDEWREKAEKIEEWKRMILE